MHLFLMLYILELLSHHKLPMHKSTISVCRFSLNKFLLCLRFQTCRVCCLCYCNMSFLPFDCGSCRDITFVRYHKNDENKKPIISVFGRRFQDTGMCCDYSRSMYFIICLFKFEMGYNYQYC